MPSGAGVLDEQRFDALYHAMGSGGTTAGLGIGAVVHGVETPIVGVCVCDDPADMTTLLESPSADAALSAGEFNADEIERMAAAPTDGPIYLFTAITYRESADYPDDRDSDLTGREDPDRAAVVDRDHRVVGLANERADGKTTSFSKPGRSQFHCRWIDSRQKSSGQKPQR